MVTCSHLIVACWQQQPDCQGGLYVDGFGYQLTSGTSVVESGVVTNTCVSFNLSTTIPNVDGYILSIWGQASPGNGPPTTLKPIAATGSVISVHIVYDTCQKKGCELVAILRDYFVKTKLQTHRDCSIAKFATVLSRSSQTV